MPVGKKENPESTKPDLVLENGKIEFSGSGGNHVITFKNNIYEYKVFHNKIAASGIADITLVVEKMAKKYSRKMGNWKTTSLKLISGTRILCLVLSAHII